MGYDSPMNTNMDDELNKMEPYLRSLGVSDRDLNNRKTREFIYDFIATHQEDELNSAQSEQPQNVNSVKLLSKRKYLILYSFVIFSHKMILEFKSTKSIATDTGSKWAQYHA